MVKPKTPRRAFALDLKVEADTLEDLIGYLRSFETDLYMGKVTHGVSGGYSAGSTYSLDVDETITHDSWAADNARYIQWLDQRDAIEARAEQIYNAMPYDQPTGTKPAWFRGGNGLKQDEARRQAEAEFEAKIAA